MRRLALRKLLDRLAAMMTAVALAEEGEAEKARRALEEAGRDEPGPRWGGGR